MAAPYNILILGASYGSLLASKLLFGGHTIKLVCLPAEADLINAEGFRVRLPVRGRSDAGRARFAQAAGQSHRRRHGRCRSEGLRSGRPRHAGAAISVSPGVRELLDAVGRAKVPCMSIMNMPPLAYLRRIPGLDTDALKPAYTDASVWDSFDPACITLCSPDPQAIRPPEEKVNVLQVTLPTNFKVARFPSEQHTAMLRRLQDEIEAIRFDTPEGKVELPVKLKVYDSIFVPLAKWAMLLAGNYRCVTKDGMRTAQEAVHSDIETSRSVYNFVVDLCIKLGAKPDDHGAVREICRRGAIADAAGVGGAGAAKRRAEHRTRRQAGAAHRRADRACTIRRSTRRWLWSTRGSRPIARRRQRGSEMAAVRANVTCRPGVAYATSTSSQKPKRPPTCAISGRGFS